VSRPVTGTCCIVLHTHLPWLAHAGAWPVGEEWLHQAWSASYDPVTELLERLAAEGRTGVLTLGVTPVVAAMLDDPYLLRQQHTWLGTWQVRAASLAPRMPDVAAYEFRLASHALERFETRWRHGGAPVLRGLADSGVVELLGGPATHPFQPLVADSRLVDAQLAVGLDDARIRLGHKASGIWAPECGYRPGLEEHYAKHGVTHFLADGPTLLGSGVPTSAAYLVGDSDVAVLGRDLDVTYRVWSPRSGYPGGRWYRDFHTFDHDSGIRPARVTSRRVAPEDKRPYDPAAGRESARRDAEDFVRVVVERLRGSRNLVVVAYDTELFGHWWHEGPVWLEHVLRLLPEAGVRLATLGQVAATATRRVDLTPGSWGSGKDWRVWEGEAVADLLAESRDVQRRLLDVVDKRRHDAPRGGRDEALDQLAREAFLVMSSDWAFCVSKDSAAAYARDRHATHVRRFTELANAIESRHEARATLAAQRFRAVDGLFGHLDARTF
jgi:1,4-alpha-glucan branching enzyme